MHCSLENRNNNNWPRPQAPQRQQEDRRLALGQPERLRATWPEEEEPQLIEGSDPYSRSIPWTLWVNLLSNKSHTCYSSLCLLNIKADRSQKKTRNNSKSAARSNASSCFSDVSQCYSKARRVNTKCYSQKGTTEPALHRGGDKLEGNQIQSKETLTQT